MGTLRTVLCDLDGTLIDSIELIRRSYTHALEVHRGRALDRAEWLSGLGRPLAWQFSRLTDDPGEIEAMIATYRAFNLAHHDRLVRPYPGIRAALAELRDAGLALAIVTSKQHAAARRGLAHCGLDDFFEVVVGVDDVERHKPHPAPVQRALERLGRDPATAVMVGDSPHDLAAGRAAGTRTAAVAWGPFEPQTLRATSPDHWLPEPAALAHLPTLTRGLDSL